MREYPYIHLSLPRSISGFIFTKIHKTIRMVSNGFYFRCHLVPAEHWTRNAPKMGSLNSRILYYKLKNGVKEKSTYDKYGRQKYQVDYNNHREEIIQSPICM